MSLKIAAQRRDEPEHSEPSSSAKAPRIRWVVKDSRAVLGAVFRDANVALRFAHRQARALG